MITTVTLNTSVDKLYLVEKLEDYTVMRVKKVSNTAGGKGLNVSKVAYLLGEKVSALGFAGGFNGSYVSSLLEAQGIRAGFTRIQAETRSCINIRELSTGRHTQFLEPGAPVTHAECDEFLSGYRETLPNSQVVTISGSVPAGVEVDFYGKLVSLAKQGGIPVIVDTSGALLAETVKAKPTMIKPNTDEIGQLLGRRVQSRQEVIDAAWELHQSGIPYVVVSLGKDGSVMACEEGIFQGITPDIPVVNTVGCGDSMVAGFAAAMARGKGPEEMLRLATAVSTANALTMQTGHFEQEDLDRVLPLTAVKKIK